jgi:hypothetical protein
MGNLEFEKLDTGGVSIRLSRAKVPGGWLLVSHTSTGVGLTFYPDPQHKWDGKSIPAQKPKAV